MTGRHAQASDTDVQRDPHVAGSRADDDEDGSHVGRKGSDDDFDAGQTGAEARGRHRR